MTKNWFRNLSVLILAAGAFLLPLSQESAFAKTETSRKDAARMGWWVNARFGMFIHWGIYAIPAKGEWYMNTGHVPRAQYEKYADQFDPTDFNADAWVKAARDAGMKYLVITSKHHDGFCMFNTKATDYNVVKATPWHKDPLKALSEACRKYGVRFCVYYSIMDWHSPYQGASQPSTVRPTYNPTHFKPGDKAKYIAYMKTQLKELVTQYHPGLIWFDGGWMEGWTSKDGKDIYNYLRKLDPKLIVNNREGGAGDYETPEQQIPPNGIPGHDWETCMTINDDWGFDATDFNFKSSQTLIRNLIDIASKGGNYLLNVGPTAKGVIPQAEVGRLDTMGTWLKANGEAIYGSTASPFTTQLPWGRCTQKPGKLFLEVFDWPKDGRLVLNGVYNLPARAFVLSDKKRTPLKVGKEGDALVVTVPEEMPDNICTVVELAFRGKPEVYNQPTIGPDLKEFLKTIDFTVSQTHGAQIRYTLDGAQPTDHSPIYSRPVRIDTTTLVSAQYFRGGKPVSGVTQATFTQVEPQPAVCDSNDTAGIDYRYYTGQWTEVPDFSALNAAHSGVLPSITFPPGSALENFGVEYTGVIKVPADGVYTFYIASDDGSMLYVGDRVIIDDNGLHGATEKSGTAALSKGAHPIRIEYFQATGGSELTVMYSGPGIKKQVIPAAVLFHSR